MLLENQKIIKRGFGYEKPEFDIWSLTDEVTNFEVNFKKTKKIIKEIMYGWEESRNSDFLLWIEYLRVKYPNIEVTRGSKNVFIKFPLNIIQNLKQENPDNPGRARRSLIQNAMKELDFEQLNNLLPTKPDILYKRLKKEKIMRNFFSKYSDKLKNEAYSKLDLK